MALGQLAEQCYQQEIVQRTSTRAVFETLEELCRSLELDSSPPLSGGCGGGGNVAPAANGGVPDFLEWLPDGKLTLEKDNAAHRKNPRTGMAGRGEAGAIDDHVPKRLFRPVMSSDAALDKLLAPMLAPTKRGRSSSRTSSSSSSGGGTTAAGACPHPLAVMMAWRSEELQRLRASELRQRKREARRERRRARQRREKRRSVLAQLRHNNNRHPDADARVNASSSPSSPSSPGISMRMLSASTAPAKKTTSATTRSHTSRSYDSGSYRYGRTYMDIIRAAAKSRTGTGSVSGSSGGSGGKRGAARPARARSVERRATENSPHQPAVGEQSNNVPKKVSKTSGRWSNST